MLPLVDARRYIAKCHGHVKGVGNLRHASLKGILKRFVVQIDVGHADEGISFGKKLFAYVLPPVAEALDNEERISLLEVFQLPAEFAQMFGLDVDKRQALFLGFTAFLVNDFKLLRVAQLSRAFAMPELRYTTKMRGNGSRSP